MKTPFVMLVKMISLMAKSRSLQICLRDPVCIPRNGGTFMSSLRTSTSSSTVAVDHGSNDNLRTHTVEWKTSDGIITFDAIDGETLRTAALRRKLVSPHNGRARLINCRGLGTCGTCAVEVETMDSVEPQHRNAVERARLAFPPHGGANQSPNLRLACQIQIRGNVTVTKRTGFWGQYEELANKSEAETYFGDLEFALDRKSPSDPSAPASSAKE